MIDLRLGDCLDVMGGIPDGSVDLILADLPYGTTACKWDVVIPFGPLWAHYRRVLKPRGAVVLTACQPFTSMLVMSNREWFRYEWIWRKNLKTDHLNARKRPMRGHESAIVFCEGQSTYNPQKTPRTFQVRAGNKRNSRTSVYGAERELDLDRQGDALMPDSVIDFACVHSSQGRLHPTQKPVALMEYLVRTYSHEGETVLDNAVGSGTTLLACLSTGRAGIGIEKDPAIFATAARRLADAAAQATPA